MKLEDKKPPKNFEEWWKGISSQRGLYYIPVKESCMIAWHAGQAAVDVVKIYDHGRGKPSIEEEK